MALLYYILICGKNEVIIDYRLGINALLAKLAMVPSFNFFKQGTSRFQARRVNLRLIKLYIYRGILHGKTFATDLALLFHKTSIAFGRNVVWYLKRGSRYRSWTIWKLTQIYFRRVGYRPSPYHAIRR